MLSKLQFTEMVVYYNCLLLSKIQSTVMLALAFIPIDTVIEAYELCDNTPFPHEAQEVVDYFEDTWIGRPNRRNA